VNPLAFTTCFIPSQHSQSLSNIHNENLCTLNVDLTQSSQLETLKNKITKYGIVQVATCVFLHVETRRLEACCFKAHNAHTNIKLHKWWPCIVKPSRMDVVKTTLLKATLMTMDKCFGSKRVRIVVSNGWFDATPDHSSSIVNIRWSSCVNATNKLSPILMKIVAF